MQDQAWKYLYITREINRSVGKQATGSDCINLLANLFEEVLYYFTG